MSKSHHRIPGSVYTFQVSPVRHVHPRSHHSTADLAVGGRTLDLELRLHLEQLEPLLCTPRSGRRFSRNLGTFWTSSPPAFNDTPWMYAFGVDGFSSGIHSHNRALSPAPAQQLRSSRVEGATPFPIMPTDFRAPDLLHTTYGLSSTFQRTCVPIFKDLNTVTLVHRSSAL